MSDVPSVPAAPATGKKRRSWFEPGKAVCFDIAVERHSSVEQLDEMIETLFLTPFSKPPSVDFGRVTLGHTVVRHLCVRNPQTFAQQVVIEKFPVKKKFEVDPVEFVVEADDEMLLTLSWTPDEACNVREVVYLKADQVSRLQFTMFAAAVDPPKHTKRKSRQSEVKILKGLAPRLARRAQSLQPTTQTTNNCVDKQQDDEAKENCSPCRPIHHQTTKHSLCDQQLGSKVVQQVTGDMRDVGPTETSPLLLIQNISTPLRRTTFIKTGHSLTPGSSPRRFPASPKTPRRDESGVEEEGFAATTRSPATLPDSLSTPIRRATFVKDLPRRTPEQLRNRRNNADSSPSPRRISVMGGNLSRRTWENLSTCGSQEQQSLQQTQQSSRHYTQQHEAVADVSEQYSDVRGIFLRDVAQSPQLLEEKLLELRDRSSVGRLVAMQRDSYESAVSHTGSSSPTESQYHTAVATPYDGASSDGSDEFQDSNICSETLVGETSLCQQHLMARGCRLYQVHSAECCEVDCGVNYSSTERVLQSHIETTGRPTFLVESRTETLNHPVVHVTESHIETTGRPTFRVMRPRTEATFDCPSNSNLNQGEVENGGCYEMLSSEQEAYLNSEEIVEVETFVTTTTTVTDIITTEIFTTDVITTEVVTDDVISMDTVTAQLSTAREPLSDTWSVNNAVASQTNVITTSNVSHNVSTTCDQVDDVVFKAPFVPLHSQQGSSLSRSLQSLKGYKPLFATHIEQIESEDSKRLSSTPTMWRPSSVDSLDRLSTSHSTSSIAPSPITAQSQFSSYNCSLDSDVDFFHSTAVVHDETYPLHGSHNRPHINSQTFTTANSDQTVDTAPSTYTKCRVETIGHSHSPHNAPGARPASRHLFTDDADRQREADIVPLDDTDTATACYGARWQDNTMDCLPQTEQCDVTDSGASGCGYWSDTGVGGNGPGRRSSLQGVFYPVGGQTRHMISPGQKRQSLIAKLNGSPCSSTRPQSAALDAPVDRKTEMAKIEENKKVPEGKRGHVDGENSPSKKRTMQRSTISGTAVSGSVNKSTAASGVNTSRAARSRSLAVAQSKLTLVDNNSKHKTVRQSSLYASRNMYYDERWMEKQEAAFVKWLNFILTPPEMYFDARKQKVDVGSLTVSHDKTNVLLAPSKEDMSLRAYNVRSQMNRLRRASCLLFQHPSVTQVIEKLEREIEMSRLAVRTDRMIHADLGLKQKILDMLLSYNPLWLRIGLETVFGEVLYLHSNTDIIGLSRFILTRLLSNPDIAAEYSHPNVRHLYKPGYQEALSKFTLKKFLLLVLFLDKAKVSHLIDYNPCLFCKDSDYKASRDLLLTFSRDYLRGEGDLTRHLSYLGYTVSHIQTTLDEYDYAVTNLATDLRDGLKLTRLIEVLTGNWTLSTELRVPAISRLQKVHNVSVVFHELGRHGVSVQSTKGGKVEPRDVVDGHRQKTLQLLWALIFVFKVDVLLSETELKHEISLVRKYLTTKQQLELATCESLYTGDQQDTGGWCSNSVGLSLLLQWCQTVCSLYNMKIENFTVSFNDGRAFCYLVHHYYPSVLPRDLINTRTFLSCGIGRPCLDELTDSEQLTAADIDALLSNERHNFKLLHDAVSVIGGVPVMLKTSDMSNTMPDEKTVITYLSYLCSRLFVIRNERRAAIVIQTAWRRYYQRFQHRAVDSGVCRVAEHVTVDQFNNIETEKQAQVIERWSDNNIDTVSESRVIEQRSELEDSVPTLTERQQEMLRPGEGGSVEMEGSGIVEGREVTSSSQWNRLDETTPRLAGVLSDDGVLQSNSTEHVVLYNGETKHRMEELDTDLEHLENTMQIHDQAERMLEQLGRIEKQCETAGDRVEKLDELEMVQTEYEGNVELNKQLEGLTQRGVVRELEISGETQTQCDEWKELTVETEDMAVVEELCDVNNSCEWCNVDMKPVEIHNREQLIDDRSGAVNGVKVLPADLQSTVLPTSDSQSTVLPTSDLQSSVLPTSDLQSSVLPTSYLQSTVLPTSDLQSSVLPTSDLQSSVLPTRDLQSTMLPTSDDRDLQSTVLPTNDLHSTVLPTNDQQSTAVLPTLLPSAALSDVAVSDVQITRCCIEWSDIETRLETVAEVEEMDSIDSYLEQSIDMATIDNVSVDIASVDNVDIVSPSSAAALVSTDSDTATIDSVNIVCPPEVVMALMSTRSCSEQSVDIHTVASVDSVVSNVLMTAESHLQQSVDTSSVDTGSVDTGAMSTVDINTECHLQQSVDTSSVDTGSVDTGDMSTVDVNTECHLQQSVDTSSVDTGSVDTGDMSTVDVSAALIARQHAAAVKIQSAYRRHVTERLLKSQLELIVSLQRAVRCYQQLLAFHVARGAAITIQSWYRSRCCKHEYQSTLSRIVLIQRHVRHFLARQRHEARQSAAVKIQAAFHGYRQRVVYRRLVSVCAELHLITRHRPTQQQQQQQQRGKLQQLVVEAAISGRTHSELVDLARAHAATVIQTAYAAHRQQLLRRSVVTSQMSLRSSRWCTEFQLQRNAAVTIQRQWRAWILMKLDRQRYLLQLGATIIIQSAVRQFVCRRRYTRLRSAIIHLQTAFRQRKQTTMTLAAVIVQSVVRCFIARRRFLKLRSAALCLQTSYRAHRHRAEFLARKTAATTIQCWFRQLVVRHTARHNAAGTIQRAFRHYQHRRQHTAAVKIQSTVRMFVTRCRYLKLKQCVESLQRSLAAVKLQRLWRAKMCRRQVLLQQEMMLGAAISIQACYRGYINRKKFLIMQNGFRILAVMCRTRFQRKQYLAMHAAATTIQTRYRAVLAGRLQRKQYLAERKAAVTLQTRYRAVLAGRLQRKQYLAERKAAVTIQTRYRAVLAGRLQRKQYLAERKAAVTLQTRYRAVLAGRLQRKQYLAERKAAVTLQTRYRAVLAGRLQRKQYLTERKAAVTLQTRYRAVLAGRLQRKQYLAERKAAVTLQTRYRAVLAGRLQRKQYLTERKAAVTLQTRYRAVLAGRLQRKQYLAERKAAVTLQTRYRAVLAGRLQRKQFLTERKAAVTLQTRYRAVLAHRLQRKQYLTERKAAVTLQTRYRAVLAGRLQRKQYLAERKAAVTLQTRYRAVLAGRLQRKQYLTERKAAVTLQTRYRAVLAGRLQRKQYLAERKAAVTLQTRYRAVLAGRLQRKQYLAERKAAVTIQTRYRAVLAGRLQRKQYLAERKAAVTIQTRYRAVLAGRLQRKQFLAQRKAVVALQTRYRAVLAGRLQRKQFLAQRKAVVALQTRYRAVLAGRLQRKQFLAQRKAVVTLQTQYRAVLAGRLQRKQYLTERKAAVTLQTRYRAMLAGRLQRKQFLAQCKAVVALQTQYRAVLAGRLQRKQYLTERKAAVTLQTRYRAMLAGRAARAQFLQLRTTVVHLQAVFRGRRVRRLVETRRLAVVTLQSACRGFLIRKLVQKQHSAATTIQKFVRGYISRQQYSKRQQHIVHLQALCRGFLVRQHIRRQRVAAILLQRLIRGMIQRRTYQKQKSSAVIMQSNVRRMLVHRQFTAMKRSCVTIQRWWRSVKTGKCVRQQFLISVGAAVTIQATFRRHAAVKIYRKMLTGFTCLQATWRMKVTRRQYNALQTAAVTVQCRFRANIACKQQRQSYVTLRHAAVTVQRRFRAIIACKQQRQSYETLRQAAVTVQRRFRAIIACRQQRQSYETLRHATLIIQRYRRQQLIVRQEKITLKRQTVACTLIQSTFRMYIERHRYVRQRHAVTLMQATARQWLCRQRYVHTVQTVIKLQRVWRRVLALRRLERAAICIQAAYRRYIIGRWYRNIRASAVLIQRSARVYIHRQRYIAVRQSTITIQRWYRNILIGRQQRADYLQIREAIIAVQRAVRHTIAVRREREISACVKIQSWYRMVVSRRSFVARKSAVVGIQSAIRGYLQRQQYVRKLQQIVRLQCVMRSWLVRRQCNRLRTLRTAAATCIQAHVRGYWCRKQLAMQQQQRAVRLVQIVLTVRKHLAAVRIQRIFRKYRSILHAKHNIDSVVTIQRWMRVWLQRRHYVRIHSSLCRLQLLARDWLTVRQNSAALIQRTYKQYTARQQIKRMQGSATSIQALWRGYRLRRQVKDKKIHEARLKVQQATRNVKEENKLCHRTSSALDFLLTYKQLSQVLEALINLDVVTRLSPQCCQRLVEGNAVGVLYRLMHSCNRSLPHMELIRYAINILLNLSKYEVTSAAVFEPADSLEVLVELLQIYREKGPIFTNTCMLLGIMGFDSTRRQLIHTKSPLVEKLRSIHTLTVRKHQLDHKRLSAKTKTLGVCYPASRQSISPAWSMRRNTVHYIDDPLNAVTFMMTSLQIQPK